MLVLGLHGSPRKKGNTHFLLSLFLDEAARLGADTHLATVTTLNILPCKELVVCEKKGYCPLEDDMKTTIYPLLRAADVILLASPVFFYNVTAQLKAVIDRCQTLWARKYRLKLSDPARGYRKGFLLSAGATRGKQLFEGMKLTAQYFFDAVGAEFSGSLTYRGIEGPKDLSNHPTVRDDVAREARSLLKPLAARRKVLFVCRKNDCSSQMAGAFTQHYAGDRFDVVTGGFDPAESVDPVMVEVMQEKSIDMAFRTPQTIDAALKSGSPEVFVTVEGGVDRYEIPGARRMGWDLTDPRGQTAAIMRQVRDRIEGNVQRFIEEFADT